jgi:signal transduction histidine kinase
MDPLLDHAPFGFAVIRDDGYVELANHTLGEILESDAAKIVGKHVDAILTGPSRIFYQTHFFPILKLQGRVQEVYVSMLSANGGEIPVLLNATRREGDDGSRSHWAVVPMSTRNEYENEILKARKAAESASASKDAFISFVSHELRSPLSAVMGWTALLTQGPVDPVKLKRGMESIERNAKLQLKLVDDMLDHARLASGKVRMEVARVDARTILETVLDGVDMTAKTRGVTVVRDIEPGALDVNGDAERLQQAFWNVLSNAVKFTSAGGRVSVSMHRRQGWIEIVVIDTGKGIVPEFLPYVFESFRQEEGRAVRTEGGLGLGMAITRRLVELHGGTIAAESAGPDLGSTFTLRLPALAVATAPL